MTEREKMEAGLPFRDDDAELQALHFENLHSLHLYNACDPMEKDRRGALLHQIVPHAGPGFYAQSPFYCDYGFHIRTGKNVYLNFGCVILDVGRITIGDNVLIGPRVSILAVGHPIAARERVESGADIPMDVTIGDNVWIGAGAIVNPGVHIGENSVIGSGSIVTRDIPAGVVAAGNPCRVIREIGGNDEK